MAGVLFLTGCGQSAGTIVNATDQAIFVTLGADGSRIYVAAGESIASGQPRPVGPVTVISTGSGMVRCVGGGSTGSGDGWRVMVTGTQDALTCVLY